MIIALTLVTAYPNIELAIGLGALVLSLISSNLINAFFDFEFDKLSRYKRQIAIALEYVGIRNAFWLSLGFPLLAVLLAFSISPWHALLIGVWNVLSIIDAAPPIRVKERGIVRYLAFGLAQAFLVLFFYALLSVSLELFAFVVAYLVSSVSVSFAMVHEALDVHSDSKVGLRTSVARMGANSFLKITWLVSISALVVSVFMPIAALAIFVYSEKLRRLRVRINHLPTYQQEEILNRRWSTSKYALAAMLGILAGAVSARLGLSLFPFF